MAKSLLAKQNRDLIIFVFFLRLVVCWGLYFQTGLSQIFAENEKNTFLHTTHFTYALCMVIHFNL